MINFRYHVVSLTAVFLALAIGLVVGTAALNGPVADSLKVLKGLAEYLAMSLGDLVEGIALHALEGKASFSPETLVKIEQHKAIHGVTLTAATRTT